MNRDLPPLAAIRVFEAAARHLSFTRAADELGMTQAAVSYQIKVLEERLGTPLFLRRPRELVLTEAGRGLAPETTRAFDILREAYASPGGAEQGTLIVNTMHTFAAQWLAPRLGSFAFAHPDIGVRLETTQRVVDFAREEVDAVIRSGRDGQWPGLRSIRLMRVTFTPMLSPALAETIGGVHEPADILRLPLLDPRDDFWIKWLDAHGFDHAILDRQTAPTFNLQTLDAEAAMAGRGVALLTPDFFARELADGRLLRPFDTTIDEGNSYWLAFQESRRNVPKIRIFRDWILAQIDATRGA